MIFTANCRLTAEAQPGGAPPRQRKMGGGKFTGESCKWPPDRQCTREAEQEFSWGNWGYLGGRRGYLGSFSMFLRATTTKVITFLGKKSAPQTKSWLRLCLTGAKKLYWLAEKSKSNCYQFTTRKQHLQITATTCYMRTRQCLMATIVNPR